MDTYYRKIKNKNLVTKFNITIDQFEELKIKQNGLCYNCNFPQTGKKDLVIFKSLVENKIMGLLCGNCSRRLKAKDRSAYLRLINPEEVKNKLIDWKNKNKNKVKQYSKRFRIKNKEKIKLYQKKWVEKNRDRISKQAKERYLNSKMEVRDYQLRIDYGISLTEYNDMLLSQNGVCAICKGPPGAKSYSVDHSHTTGKVRGLLCRGCNVGIGNLKDSPEILELAAKYLRSTR